ncbi:hypothetical protein [Christiangramia portivictoriae]|uniref:hypothetical protein n=1 Tax=Christiangramia portivictoriae TaxID=326069 RepID=UPI000403C254|nr:hypothetical protein [Christiangramia portivictoriae]
MKKIKTESKSAKLISEDKKEIPYNPEVTKQDKQVLHEKGRSLNEGQDKDLSNRQDVDFTPDELDIPASNDARAKNKTELVDEENMQYNQKGASDAN